MLTLTLPRRPNTIRMLVGVPRHAPHPHPTIGSRSPSDVIMLLVVPTLLRLPHTTEAPQGFLRDPRSNLSPRLPRLRVLWTLPPTTLWGLRIRTLLPTYGLGLPTFLCHAPQRDESDLRLLANDPDRRHGQNPTSPLTARTTIARLNTSAVSSLTLLHVTHPLHYSRSPTAAPRSHDRLILGHILTRFCLPNETPRLVAFGPRSVT